MGFILWFPEVVSCILLWVSEEYVCPEEWPSDCVVISDFVLYIPMSDPVYVIIIVIALDLVLDFVLVLVTVLQSSWSWSQVSWCPPSLTWSPTSCGSGSLEVTQQWGCTSCQVRSIFSYYSSFKLSLYWSLRNTFYDLHGLIAPGKNWKSHITSHHIMTYFELSSMIRMLTSTRMLQNLTSNKFRKEIPPEVLAVQHICYTGWPRNNGTVDTVDFSGLCSNQQLFSSPCWIEHLFPILITPRSSNLVENFLFYETFLVDCHFRDLPDFQSFEARWQINGKSQKLTVDKKLLIK